MKLAELHEDTLDEGRRLKAAIAAAALAFGAHSAYGQEAPEQPTTVSVSQEQGVFDTMDEAAKAGFKIVKQKSDSHKYEYGFAICKTKDGKFVFSEPLTAKHESDINGIQIKAPAGSVIVAIAHSHPDSKHVRGADNTSGLFSDGDVKFAKDHPKWKMYMASMKTGKIVQYQHGVKDGSRNVKGKYETGTEVGDFEG